MSLKKRAISPIIAVILLIGLTVAAGALVYIIVIPILQPKANIEFLDTYYYYNEGLTTPKKNPKAQADVYVVEFTVYNTGTAIIQIEAIAIQDKFGETITHELHTPENLGVDLSPLDRSTFLLSFTKKTKPPATLLIVVTLTNGRTFYSTFIPLE